jgi:CheY-like chemotaxis protein
VDDQVDNRVFASGLLAAVGFETRLAAGGDEAVHAFHHWQPHLVLMDMRMPVVDGSEAIRRIRGSASGASVKIIAVTASAFEEDRTGAHAAGADDFLSKPFREEVLFEKIGALLGVRYDYDEQAAAQEQHPSTPMITTAEVARLPLVLREALAQATRSADLDLMLAILTEMNAEDAGVASALRALAEKFAYQQILALSAPGPGGSP